MLRNIMRMKINPFQKQNSCYSSTCQEVRIPVPWGHIAGKWWGSLDKRPILATHGWQDNSGTFDTLIPLLPKTTSFLAIDFPGCGYSSKVPPGVFYHLVDLIFIIRRIVTYFGWSRVSLLGHSMGAGANYGYTMLFPDEVEFLICLDLLKPVVEDKSIDEMASNIDLLLKLDHLKNMNKKPPRYFLQEMEQRLYKTYNSVALDKCKYILKRNIEPSNEEPDKFYSTIDPLLKVYSLLDFFQDDWLKTAYRLSCPIFYCKSDKFIPFEKQSYAIELIEAIKKHNKNFEIHFVKGTHHVHLNNPKCLESVLNEFLAKYDIDDRSNSGLKLENLV